MELMAVQTASCRGWCLAVPAACHAPMWGCSCNVLLGAVLQEQSQASAGTLMRHERPRITVLQA